jgi:hypothetical protein
MWALNLPCSPVEVDRVFGGKYCIDFQCQGNRFSSNQKKQAKVTALITACPVFDPENGGRMFVRNVGGLIEENTVFFMVTSMGS